MKIIKSQQTTLVYVVLLSVSMILTAVFQGKTGEYIFATWITLTIISELIMKSRGEKVIYKNFYLACGTMALAMLIWTGDIQGWWCDPVNHYFQGHAVWH